MVSQHLRDVMVKCFSLRPAAEKALLQKLLCVCVTTHAQHSVECSRHSRSSSIRQQYRVQGHLCIHFSTHRTNMEYKPVGDWISAPSPNFVVMATRVGTTIFCMVPLNRPSPKKNPGRPKHLRSVPYKLTYR